MSHSPLSSSFLIKTKSHLGCTLWVFTFAIMEGWVWMEPPSWDLSLPQGSEPPYWPTMQRDWGKSNLLGLFVTVAPPSPHWHIQRLSQHNALSYRGDLFRDGLLCYCLQIYPKERIWDADNTIHRKIFILLLMILKYPKWSKSFSTEDWLGWKTTQPLTH